MRNYKRLLQRNENFPTLESIQRDIEEVDKWEDAYWIGQFVFGQASGKADKLIMDAYEKAFRLGLNIRVDKKCFLSATFQLVRIYFLFEKYDDVINTLLILESNVGGLPDWGSRYYVAAQIQTDAVWIYAENPSLLFNRIECIYEENIEAPFKAVVLYMEFLNRLSEGIARENSFAIKTSEIIEKAEKLGLGDSVECQNFKIAAGIINESSNDEKSIEDEFELEDNQDELELYELRQLVENQEKELHEKNDFIDEILKRLEESQNIIQTLQDKKEEDGESCQIKHLAQNITVAEDFLPRRQKILIIGGSETKESHLRGKLKRMGFEFGNDQLEFELGYSDVKGYSSRIVRWSGKYAGIIVGPCPHKVKDAAGYSSFIQQLKTEEGYPHVEEARDKSGNLKISNASIGDAMMRMVVYLQSIV